MKIDSSVSNAVVITILFMSKLVINQAIFMGFNLQLVLPERSHSLLHKMPVEINGGLMALVGFLNTCPGNRVDLYIGFGVLSITNSVYFRRVIVCSRSTWMY